MHHLLDNAIQFSNPYSEHKEIKIQVKSGQDSLLIAVSDNGLGIPAHILPQIFDMYFVGSEYSKGNGLGLFVVKKLLDRYKGNIDVKSEIGGNTTFQFTFPCKIMEKIGVK